MNKKITNEDVRPIRDAMGVTQQQFAYRLNVSVRIVSMWETGKVTNIHPANMSMLRTLKKKHIKGG